MSQLIASSPAPSVPSSPTNVSPTHSALQIEIPGHKNAKLNINKGNEYVAMSEDMTMNFRLQPRQGGYDAPYSAVPAGEGEINAGLWSPSVGRLIRETHNSLAFSMPNTPQHEPGQTPTSPSAKLSQYNSSRKLQTTNKTLSPREINSRQIGRRHRAEMKRAHQAQEKKMKLVTKGIMIRHKKHLIEQTHQLKQLRTKIKHDYGQSHANIKRQMLLQDRVQTLGRQGEYVMNVAILTRLRKAIILKRSLSTSFVDALYSTAEEEIEDTAAQRELDEEEDAKYEEGYEDIMNNFESLLALPSDLGFAYQSESVSSPTKESAFSPLLRSLSVPELIAKTSHQPLLSLRSIFGERLPPITRFTLAELEVDTVLSGWRIRHDLVFDPDLRFKPNEVGTRGVVIREEHDLFWKSITLEETSKLLLLINEARAIIVELVTWPEEHLQRIEEGIDISLIEQQISQKSYNPSTTLLLFGELIKQICAPVRDAEVEEMEKQVTAGEFLLALRTLFTLMENVKLDVVNNSMRKIRPWIVQDAPSFELREFERELQFGKQSLMKTTFWLCKELPTCKLAHPDYNPKDIFYTCYVDLIQNYSVQKEGLLPETFDMDKDRIRALYSTWEDIAVTANVLMVFKQAQGPKAAIYNSTEARKRIRVLLEDKESTIDNIHFEMANQAGILRGSAFTPAEVDNLGKMLQKTLTAGNPVYELILTRVGLHLADRIRLGKLDEEKIAKHGMTELVPELNALGEKMKFLADHNLSIFSKIYDSISKQVFSDEPFSDDEEEDVENETSEDNSI